MVAPTTLLAFTLASLVIVVMPGPSVLFVIGRSIALGARAGVLSVAGNALGMLPLVALVAVGLGAVVASSAAVFTAVKLVGAAYLVFLGIQAIRHRHAHTTAGPAAAQGGFRLLRQGFIVGVTNPKTIAFFVAVLPQFVDRAVGAVPAQMLQLGAVFVVLAFLCDSIWALAAGAARDWFARTPRRLSTLGASGGVMMIGLGGGLALSGSKA